MTPDNQLGPRMRWLLMACGPMNVIGAISFAPPVTAGRASLGLPEAPPFYLWLIAAWILAFGAAYFWQGWTGRADRTFLAVGAFGKAVFAGLLIAGAVAGELPPTAVAGGLPDLALAVVFAGWLWRTRVTGRRAAARPAAPSPVVPVPGPSCSSSPGPRR
jgi:hypothetical protein